MDQRPAGQPPADPGAARGSIGADPPQPPRPHPPGDRHAAISAGPSTAPSRPSTPSPHRRTAPRWCGGRFEFFAKVETAGIEPASAVAQKVASTSVAGTLISPSTRLAGGVVGGQLRRCPRRGWSGPHRVSLLFEPGPPPQANGGRLTLSCELDSEVIGVRICVIRTYFFPGVLRGLPGPRLATTPANRPRRSLSSPGICVHRV